MTTHHHVNHKILWIIFGQWAGELELEPASQSDSQQVAGGKWQSRGRVKKSDESVESREQAVFLIPSPHPPVSAIVRHYFLSLVLSFDCLLSVYFICLFAASAAVVWFLSPVFFTLQSAAVTFIIPPSHHQQQPLSWMLNRWELAGGRYGQKEGRGFILWILWGVSLVWAPICKL